MGSTRNSGLFVVIFLFAAWASQATSRTLPGQVLPMTERHEQWMAQYGRIYKDAAEKEYRFQIFKTNVELIESFNSAGHRSYRLGINAFTDLTNEEFKSSRNGYKPTREKASDSTSFVYEMVTAPASVDWRKKGAVTPIKDQRRMW
ncbi:hypothetical protein ACLOJK_010504 [Asimina triloba]